MKKKGHNKIVFKQYNMNQLTLPMSLESLIGPCHLVRIVNEAIESMRLDKVLAKYPGGGASTYHPKMMLKILLYGYSQKVWSSRMIAKSVRENVHFMWLAGGNQPDFRTINRFRLEMKDTVDEVFEQLMKYLVSKDYIKLENYFLDGTKIEANANKYSFVWKKSTKKQHDKLQETVKGLLEQIERANELDNEVYGDEDLSELGEHIVDDPESFEKLIQDLNEALDKKSKKDKSVKITRKITRKLSKDCLPRAKRYKAQLGSMGEKRNSMSKTDPEATFMRMKEDHMKNGQLKPGYNVQIGTENQFVVGFSIHSNATDTTCLKEHLESVKKTWQTLPKTLIADAGYGSEENYEYLKKQQIENYVKFNMFHQEQKQSFKKNPFRKENMPYDVEKDQYTCLNGKRLTYVKTKDKKSSNGYVSQVRIYECEDCTSCPHREACTKSMDCNRRLEVNVRLEELKQEARSNLLSEAGIALRKRRCIEPEYVFGRIKWCWGFKRFLLRGTEKVKLEWGLFCIAHNLAKLAVLQRC